MKSKIDIVFIVIILSAVLNACSIEKRHHLRGYHIEWKFKHKQKSDTVKTDIPQEQTYSPAKANSAEQIKTQPDQYKTFKGEIKTITTLDNSNENVVIETKPTIVTETPLIVLNPSPASEETDKVKNDQAIMDAEDSFIFGIISLASFLVFFPLAIWPAILAIGRGKRALVNYKGDDIKVKIKAKQGRMMGTIAMVLWILMALFTILMLIILFA